MAYHDVTALLMGDPGTSLRRTPTQREALAGVNGYGVPRPRREMPERRAALSLEIGDVLAVESRGRAIAVRLLLWRNGKRGSVKVLPDGSYCVKRML
jgi:hypothetical protein